MRTRVRDRGLLLINLLLFVLFIGGMILTGVRGRRAACEDRRLTGPAGTPQARVWSGRFSARIGALDPST